MRSFYNVLECDEKASDSDLKIAYHSQLRKTHPDKTVDAEVGLLNKVQLAYQTLKWVF